MSEYDCAVLGLAHGTQQSPIDIQKRQAFKADLPEISFAYPSEIRGRFKKNAWDEDHPFFAISKAIPANITFGKTNAELKQIHFHAPSEHKLEGQPLKTEFHFVHEITGPNEGEADFDQREPSTKIVIGVFADASSCKEKSEDKELLEKYKKFSDFFGAFREEGGCGEESEEIEFPPDFIEEIKKSAVEYFHYRGSLTTGAYAEVVTWLVLPNPIAIHVCLPNEIEKAEQHTRAVQPINRRTIMYRSGK
jgi:carbonic anhydrase